MPKTAHRLSGLRTQNVPVQRPQGSPKKQTELVSADRQQNALATDASQRMAIAAH